VTHVDKEKKSFNITTNERIYNGHFHHCIKHPITVVLGLPVNLIQWSKPICLVDSSLILTVALHKAQIIYLTFELCFWSLYKASVISVTLGQKINASTVLIFYSLNESWINNCLFQALKSMLEALAWLVTLYHNRIPSHLLSSQTAVARKIIVYHYHLFLFCQ
jgi:hypothetical protein